MDDVPPDLHVTDVQAVLNVSRSSVYRLVRLGELTLVKVLGGSRITRESLDAYRARQRAAATPAHGVPQVPHPRGTLADLEADLARWGGGAP